jgi:steroid 5-alpha reductase family enzyme
VPERVGAIDLATTASEVVLVGLLVTLLAPRARRSVGNILMAAGAIIWALRLTGNLP